METDKTNQESIQIQKLKERIDIKGKSLPENFMVSAPCTSVDYDIICDILNPDFLHTELEEQGGKDYVGGICYGLNTHDTTMRTFLKRKAQTTLIDGKSVAFMMEYLNRVKVRLIEPESEQLRLAPRNALPFSHLKKVPDYLQEYIRNRQNQEDKDYIHNNFWRNLFKEEGSKKMKIAHFISWVYEKEISERKGDLFIPSVPYIRRNLPTKVKNDFLFYTKEINRISYNLYGEESAFYFNIDADLFIDGDSINQLNDMIINAPNKYIFFKVLYPEKMSNGQFGHYAKKNFEDFLNTLLTAREIDSKRVIGMLNGGGFGYCLLNVVLNFFTDTVHNFPTYSRGKRTGKHRSLLHPINLFPERIEGVLQQLNLHKSLFLDDSVAEKYKGMDKQEFVREVNKNEWSRDARKMGILMWQKLISARSATDKNKMFDEVINSGFSFLGQTLRHIKI